MKKLPANLVAALFAVAGLGASAAEPAKTACVQPAPASTTAGGGAAAASYAKTADPNAGMPNRISMNVTVPKQTQGATFGEKVNAGLHAAGGALGQGAAATPKGGNDCDDADDAARKDKTGASDASAGAGAGAAAAAAGVKAETASTPVPDNK